MWHKPLQGLCPAIHYPLHGWPDAASTIKPVFVRHCCWPVWPHRGFLLGFHGAVTPAVASAPPLLPLSSSRLLPQATPAASVEYSRHANVPHTHTHTHIVWISPLLTLRTNCEKSPFTKILINIQKHIISLPHLTKASHSAVTVYNVGTARAGIKPLTQTMRIKVVVELDMTGADRSDRVAHKEGDPCTVLVFVWWGAGPREDWEVLHRFSPADSPCSPRQRSAMFRLLCCFSYSSCNCSLEGEGVGGRQRDSETERGMARDPGDVGAEEGQMKARGGRRRNGSSRKIETNPFLFLWREPTFL